MDAPPRDVVFFDFIRTLGRARVSADGRKLLSFDVYAATRDLLRRLRDKVRLGLLAFDEGSTGEPVQDLLAATDLGSFFEPGLVERLPVLAATHFAALANRAQVPPERCLFVSRDAIRRSVAIEAQFRVAQSAKYVEPILAGETTTYVRLRSNRSPDASLIPLLSISGFQLLELGDTGPTHYGFATDSAKQNLQHAGFKVEDFMHPETAAVTRLFVIRDGLDAEFLAHVRRQLRIVEETKTGLIIGLPPDRSLSDFHPKRTAHGHTRLIPFAVPSRRHREKTEGAVEVPAAGRAEAALMAAEAETPCDPDDLPVGTLSDDDAAILSELDGALVQQYLEPLVGASELNLAGNITINSRATGNSASNQRAVEHLANELQTILGSSSKFPFTCDLGDRFNVEAEITGGSCPKSVIVIGAHLDSTAIDTAGWIGSTQEAPGADDDASGVAAVLAVAKVLAKLEQPKRTIRFVLFNAEEDGFLGSSAYAEDINDTSTDNVLAMIQMDMIGHLNAAAGARQFELHPPGSADFSTAWAHVIPWSEALANTIAALAAVVSPTLVVQPYPIAPCTNDPVAWRSDHNSFLVAQMPACAVSEELFGDTCASSGIAHPHPGYHVIHDTIDIIDTAYVADIARAVAAAAWVIANG